MGTVRAHRCFREDGSLAWDETYAEVSSKETARLTFQPSDAEAFCSMTPRGRLRRAGRKCKRGPYRVVQAP